MREIIFRGYSQDYGWVYGDYSPAGKNYPANILPREDSANWDAFEGIVVKPDTVGQYTGSTDKNGKKIFEGDVIKYDNACFVVIFADGFAAFATRSSRNTEHAPRFTPITTTRMEVIGNRWDNPELL